MSIYIDKEFLEPNMNDELYTKVPPGLDKIQKVGTEKFVN